MEMERLNLLTDLCIEWYYARQLKGKERELTMRKVEKKAYSYGFNVNDLAKSTTYGN